MLDCTFDLREECERRGLLPVTEAAHKHKNIIGKEKEFLANNGRSK